MRREVAKGFEAIRLYFQVENDTLRVIRILHGKQDVRRLLEVEEQSGDQN